MPDENKRIKYVFENGKITKTETNESKKQNYFERLFDKTGREKADPNLPFEKMRREAKKQESIKKVFRAFLFVFVMACISAGIVVMFFKIENVNVTGESVYEADDIIKSSQLLNMNMFFIDEDKLAEELTRKYPELKEVKIKKQFPNTVKIEVVSNTAECYIKVDNEYFIVSNELDVMSCTHDLENLTGLTELVLSEYKGIVVGETVEFNDSVFNEYIIKVINAVKTHNIGENINKIDLSDKFAIELEYENRITVQIGNGDSVETKCSLAEAYINTLPNDAKGILYASDTSQGSFMSYDTTFQ